MKLRVFNKSDSAVFVDSKGNSIPTDAIQLGPRVTTIIECRSEKDYIDLSKKHQKTLIIRKL